MTASGVLCSPTLSSMSCVSDGFYDDACPTGSVSLMQRKSVSKKLAAEAKQSVKTTARQEHVNDLQAEAAKLMLKTTITPEVNETLTGMITTIEDHIEDNIKADADATQTELNSTIMALSNATAALPALKSSVDSTGQTNQSCRTTQLSLSKSLEDCKTSKNTMLSTKLSKCEDRDNKSSFEVKFNTALTCDFSLGNCADSITAYQTEFNSWLENQRTDIATAHSQYTTAKEHCETATQAFEQKSTECDGNSTAYTNKVIECNSLETTHQIAQCTFGDKLQVKCGRRAEYEALVAHINETNAAHTHSDNDRKTEWASIRQLKCLIKTLQRNAPLDSNALSTCTKEPTAAEDDFEKHVGSTDTRASEFQSLLANDFNCDPTMTSITFNGSSYAFTRDLALPPFAHCAN